MILVDNFKVILVVGLMCAAGLHSTDALICKKQMEQDYCEEGIDTCKADDTGEVGCIASEDCTEPEVYCCNTDNCNDLSNPETRRKICAKVKGLTACSSNDETGGGEAASGRLSAAAAVCYRQLEQCLRPTIEAAQSSICH